MGALVWLAWLLLDRGAVLAFESLFLVGPLVVVPLALGGVRTKGSFESLFLRSAHALQVPAAVLVAASFLLPTGALAGALVVPWLGVLTLLAVHGAARFLARGWGPLEELLMDVALVYVPVGGAWLTASRLGLEPMGFREPVVLLTAVHFHFAAFAALVFASLVGRAMLPAPRWIERAYAAAAIGLLTGPALLATGIALFRPLEIAAALVLAASVTTVAALAFVRLVVRRGPMASSATRVVLGLACLASLASMAAAAAWATRVVALDLGDMARLHGAVNAFVLLPLGLAAMAALAPPPRGPGPAVPFSRLMSTGHTGPDFFERTGAVDEGPRRPTGLVDDLSHYAKPGFDPARVDPAIRAFYENTAQHSLLVFPSWKRGFRLGGRLYRRYALRAGQMCLPLVATPHGEKVASRIIAVRDDVDGRTNVRAWVRTYAETGAPVYVAAYSTHQKGDETYMNIAFPFPRWNLTSILRIDAFGDGGVSLTTRASSTTWGDQGVYAVTRRGRVRLPMNETIRVWRPGSPGMPFEGDAPVLARHEIWVLGIRALTLDYHITR